MKKILKNRIKGKKQVVVRVFFLFDSLFPSRVKQISFNQAEVNLMAFKWVKCHCSVNYINNYCTWSVVTDPSRHVVYTDGCCTRNGKKGAKAGIGVFWGDNDHRYIYKIKTTFRFWMTHWLYWRSNIYIHYILSKSNIFHPSWEDPVRSSS